MTEQQTVNLMITFGPDGARLTETAVCAEPQCPHLHHVRVFTGVVEVIRYLRALADNLLVATPPEGEG